MLSVPSLYPLSPSPRTAATCRPRTPGSFEARSPGAQKFAAELILFVVVRKKAEKYGRNPKDTSPTPEGFWVDKRGVEEWDPDLDNSAAGQNIGEPSFAQSLPTSGESSRATCAVVRFLSRL